ncbi:MAG: hypothetical protein IPF84_14155 [Proteobacteria bacterium]|nr:hypothetical protein [Pseudomonadota bacterium]
MCLADAEVGVDQEESVPDRAEDVARLVLGLDRQLLMTRLQPLEIRQQCQQQAGEDDARDHQLAQGRGGRDHLLLEAGADRGQRRVQAIRCLATGIDGLPRVFLQLASA